MKRIQLYLACFALFALLDGAANAAPLPRLLNYVSTEIGPCLISVPAHNTGVTSELTPVCKKTYERIFQQLGQSSSRDKKLIEVRVVGHPEEMKSVVPEDAAPPEWAVAVAYPELDLIALALNHKSGTPVHQLKTVFEHELSHFALRKAIGKAEVPRWFSEGVAIHQSEKSSLNRHWTLWTAVQGGNLLPLSDIQRYPGRPGQVDLAYAEAADFVAFLLKRDGWLGIRIALREMGKGEAFADAFELGFRDSVESLETAWMGGLTRRRHWVPLVTGTGAIWGFIVILFLISYATVRQREKRRLIAMEEEEAALDYFVKSGEDTPRPDPRTAGLSKQKSSTKIRIDGDIYTLH